MISMVSGEIQRGLGRSITLYHVSGVSVWGGMKHIISKIYEYVDANTLLYW